MRNSAYLLQALSLFIVIACSSVEVAECGFLKWSDHDIAQCANHYRDVDCESLSESLVVLPGGDLVRTRKDICLGERAWIENDPRYCQSHSDPDGCFGWMAIKAGDVGLCAKLRDKDRSYYYVASQLRNESKANAWLYDCYRAAANWRNDPTICDRIPYRSTEFLKACKDESLGWGQHFSQFQHSPISGPCQPSKHMSEPAG